MILIGRGAGIGVRVGQNQEFGFGHVKCVIFPNHEVVVNNKRLYSWTYYSGIQRRDLAEDISI